MEKTEEFLALKYGPCLTLDQVAPYFGATSKKSVLAMYDAGKFPLPVTRLKRPNCKNDPRVVLSKHFATYLDEMGANAEAEWKEDHKDD